MVHLLFYAEDKPPKHFYLHALGPRYLAEHLLPPRSTQITHQEVRLRSLTPRAFLAVASGLWNNLPLVIRVAPTLGTFKSQLKTWLYVQAFPPVNI